MLLHGQSYHLFHKLSTPEPKELNKYYEDLIDLQEEYMAEYEVDIESEKQRKNILARENLQTMRDYASTYGDEGKAYRFGKVTGAPVGVDPAKGYTSAVFGDVGSYERGLSGIEGGLINCRN